MPNRFIKESIWNSPSLNGLSDQAEVLFYRLLPLPDDHGCFEADPFFLKGRLFPRKQNWTEKIICYHLITLASNGILSLWVENRRLWGIFNNWRKHQNIRSLHARKTPEPRMQTLNNIDVSNFLLAVASDCSQLLTVDALIPILIPIPVHILNNPLTPLNSENEKPKKEKKPRKKKAKPDTVLTSEEVQSVFDVFNSVFAGNLKNKVGVFKTDGSKTDTRQCMEEQLNLFSSDLKSRYPEKPILETCLNIIHGVKITWGNDFCQEIADKSGRALWDAVFRFKVQHGKDRMLERIGWALDYLNRKKEMEARNVG